MQLWKQNSIKFLSAQTISLFGSSIVQSSGKLLCKANPVL